MEADTKEGISIGNQIVKDPKFADDNNIRVLTKNRTDLQQQLHAFNESRKEHSLYINKGKTKVVVGDNKTDIQFDRENGCVD